MDQEKILKTVKKYNLGILYTIEDRISDKKIKNAIKAYATNCNPKDVIILIDHTLLGSAKEGAIFTKEGYYSSSFNQFNNKNAIYSLPLKYNEIQSLKEVDNYYIEFTLANGTIIRGYFGPDRNDYLEIFKALIKSKKTYKKKSHKEAKALLEQPVVKDESNEEYSWFDGDEFFYSQYGKPDRKKALEIYLKCPTSERKYIAYKIGQIYSEGIDVEVDYEKAAYWFKEAMLYSDIFEDSIYKLGNVYLKQRQYEDVLKLLGQEAIDGDPKAKAVLGKLYSPNIDKKYKKNNYLDEKKSIQYLLEAEGYVDGEGAYQLAFYYRHSMHNTELYKKYLSWAANRNDDQALYELGMNHYLGWYDYKKDYVEAAKYIERSKNESRSFFLEEMYYYGLGVKKDLNKAKEFQKEIQNMIKSWKSANKYLETLSIREKAEKNDKRSQYELAQRYLTYDCWFFKDRNISIYWLIRAVHNGNKKAYTDLKRLWEEEYNEQH